MNLSTPPSPPALPRRWRATLRRHGFRLEANGYAQNGFLFKPGPRWLTFEATHGLALLDAPERGLDQPGLWKRAGRPGDERYVFDIPATAVSRGKGDGFVDELEDDSFEAYVRWTLASAKGELPDGWRAPALERVASWMPEQGLTLVHGTLLRQGTLVLEPRRWALQMPVVPSLPAELPAPRARCLEELIRETQTHWRMIRLVLSARENGRALVCQVNLSGAPHSEALFLASLEGVRHAVRWLIEPADLLADVTVALRVLEICPPKNHNERNEP